jgi:hypothetical protein
MVVLRELIGWVLLGIGLAAFAVVYFVFLLNRWILEAVILGMIGFAVFRAGMHLLKVAMAARAAKEMLRQPELPGGPQVLRLPPQNTAFGKQRPSVVPGSRDA